MMGKNSLKMLGRKLRSVEAALDLLDSFRSMQSGAAVQQLMASKLTDILNQFSREIDGATTIFHKSKVRHCLQGVAG